MISFLDCRFMCEGGVEVSRGGDGARLLDELGANSHDDLS